MAILYRQEALVELLLRRILQFMSLQEWFFGSQTPVWDLTAEERYKSSRHLLEYGIHNTSAAHRHLYLSCVAESVHQLDIKDDDIGLISRKLTKGSENLLLKYAGIPEERWTPSFCSQCDAFEKRQGSSIFAIFLHSATYTSLATSARKGCHLCEILCDVLDRTNPDKSGYHHTVKGHESLIGTPGVFLQIKNQRDLVLVVGWDRKVALIPLQYVDGMHFL